MYKGTAVIGVLAAIATAAPQAQAAGLVDDFAARTEGALVSFHYTMRLKGSIPLTAEGDVVYKGEAYRAVGNGMELVSDGVTRWTADNAAKELYVENASDGDDMLLTSPSALIKDLDKAFVRGPEKPSSFSGKSAVSVDLTPISEGSGIKAMTVFFVSGAPIGAEVTSPDGTVTLVTISRLSISSGPEPSFSYDASSLGADWVITDLR